MEEKKKKKTKKNEPLSLAAADRCFGTVGV